jgi:hypothetical protein
MRRADFSSSLSFTAIISMVIRKNVPFDGCAVLVAKQLKG